MTAINTRWTALIPLSILLTVAVPAQTMQGSLSGISDQKSAHNPALTAKQWEELIHRDKIAAAKVMDDAFESERQRAVEHYQQHGDAERAAICRRLKPNVDELIGRLALAATTSPDSLVETVMHTYIVQASAELKQPPK